MKFVVQFKCARLGVCYLSTEKMCDYTVALPALSVTESPSKCSHLSTSHCDSATHLDRLDELSCNNSSTEANNFREEVGTADSSSTRNSYYFQLQNDVKRLEQQLREEMQLHNVLESATEKKDFSLTSLSCIPQHVEELLSNIAQLDVAVSKLEYETISLQFLLSQERNERRIAEYHLRHSSSKSLFLSSSSTWKAQKSPLICLTSEISETGSTSKDNDSQEQSDQTSKVKGGSSSMYSTIKNVVDRKELEEICIKEDTKCNSEDGKISKRLSPRGLWDYPNRLSEEMVRCMTNIFVSLADSTTSSDSSALEHHSSFSPRGHLSNLSLSSLSERSVVSSGVQSPQVDLQCSSELVAGDDVCDPYRVREKLSWVDIGNYGSVIEVSWMSVKKKQLDYAAGELRTFRFLVEQLAKVNPIHLSFNEKLAFWINLYNALIMHAYLAYGVPRNDLKLFSLMQKAAYTVGGHSLSAAAIEYVLLKMKPPVHRPQIALLLALHKLKITEEQRKFAIDANEPLVAFALSCGMFSSPAVRIYTAENVRDQLQEAQRDFIRASVGVSIKGKLLVPKMLHCFARNSVDDAKLAVWILHYLPPNQAAFVEKCISKRRQSLLVSRNCGILPFDSRFRYLFLLDK